VNIGKAVAICMNLDSDKFTDEDKIVAIYEVMNMPTHNGVTKAAMLEMVKWLWHYSFEMEVQNESCTT
jgi:hypothetical protein